MPWIFSRIVAVSAVSAIFMIGSYSFALEKSALSAIHEEWSLHDQGASVKSVDWENRRYYCAETSAPVVVQDLGSMIQKRLDLKGKAAIFRYFKKKDPDIRSLAISGWQSLPYSVQGGFALSFGCVDASHIEKIYTVEDEAPESTVPALLTGKTQSEKIGRVNEFIDQLRTAGCDKKALESLKKSAFDTGDMEALSLVTGKVMECNSGRL
jgi:hypothetical protein